MRPEGGSGAPYGNEVTDLPPVPEALILALKARFPVPIPEMSHSDREIWFRRGAWSVIEYLEASKESQ
jgi:hypothetical protein